MKKRCRTQQGSKAVLSTRDELLAKLTSEPVRRVCVDHGVKELAVFGSLVGEHFSDQSDVDLLIEFLPEARMDLFEFCGLGNRFSELLGRKVDLVPKKGLKPLIRESVLASARIIYAA